MTNLESLPREHLIHHGHSNSCRNPVTVCAHSNQWEFSLPLQLSESAKIQFPLFLLIYLSICTWKPARYRALECFENHNSRNDYIISIITWYVSFISKLLIIDEHFLDQCMNIISHTLTNLRWPPYPSPGQFPIATSYPFDLFNQSMLHPF